MLRLIIVLVAAFSIPAFAQPQGKAPNSPPSLDNNGGGRKGMGKSKGRAGRIGSYPACVPLKEACERAGFSKSQPRNSPKNIVLGCMAPFSRGERITGITLKTTDPLIQPCIAFIKSKLDNKSAADGVAPNVPPPAQPAPSAPKMPIAPAKPAPPAAKPAGR